MLQLFVLISNLQGVGFSDTSGRPIAILDLDNLSADFIYFTFRSVVSAIAVDTCAPDKTLSIEFLLRLPQALVFLSPSRHDPSTQPRVDYRFSAW